MWMLCHEKCCFMIVCRVSRPNKWTLRVAPIMSLLLRLAVTYSKEQIDSIASLFKIPCEA